ncbi:hypothetical protein ACFQDF_18690 [Ectobacillus funiculus]
MGEILDVTQKDAASFLFVFKGGHRMKELVGTCKCCKKNIYCMAGFLNGVILKQGELLCFLSQ